ncbi:TetR/AcrR family transcriptional regulator [Allokutzneria albata]|uniref:DNA-binding transcriptional regulator, AcrR family n=1 Tax=Allokutzneria albata TaxID=211114 RepID=A0A1G9S593_ALLAB|nr:TetR/AcrR family transcriptional regulator [Allokutzneria albata]SDM30561.1 DNA-binding transcriptional regulator, AcrR family [Allokutzneria albata]
MSTADRLIESTRELLWERGYTGTSPKAIQQRAGAGQGSMYHHFAGKPDLALAAIRRTSEQLRAKADEQFTGPGTALERIAAYLRRERDVLKGCPIGRLTQDPDVMADAALRAPVAETLSWLRERLTQVLAEGRERGELDASLDPETTAATIVAVLQGGYVLARAANSVAPFDAAVTGVLGLLTPAVRCGAGATGS